MYCRDPITKGLGKPLETLATVDPIPRYLRKTDVVARFCLPTEHDIWGSYLYWMGLAADYACPLCVHARGGMVNTCSNAIGFHEYPTDSVISLYQEARHQMVKKPNTGVG
ncbi:hypothetical protein TNCV_4904081 [Trichonephila clavipes]|nr:hypothetical protein TNCV_4904081 [Trichonephila clavipes]